jgi:hypothetical protein
MLRCKPYTSVDFFRQSSGERSQPRTLHTSFHHIPWHIHYSHLQGRLFRWDTHTAQLRYGFALHLPSLTTICSLDSPLHNPPSGHLAQRKIPSGSKRNVSRDGSLAFSRVRNDTMTCVLIVIAEMSWKMFSRHSRPHTFRTSCFPHCVHLKWAWCALLWTSMWLEIAVCARHAHAIRVQSS